MYAYVWEYRVDAERRDAFEAAYGPEGEWVRLFRRGDGYVRTELLHDRDDPQRYLTIDYWRSAEAFAGFRHALSGEFEELDRRLEQLTSSERKIGDFDEVR